MSSNFLFELGTEELPPKSLLSLSEALAASVQQQLKALGLKFESFDSFASPRRLAFLVKQLDEHTPVSEVENFGPPAKVAFDKDGNATKAALAFCQRNGVSIDEVSVASDGKVEKLVCKVTKGGELSSELLPGIVESALAELPIAKRMRWGSSRTEFVRPVQWLVFMQDDQVLNCSLLGKTAGNTTRGHRFHSSGTIVIDDITNYKQILREQGKVIANYAERRRLIKQQVEAVANNLNGRAVIDDDLLNEVSALVEWPVALGGSFDKEFLSVPPEALISSMKEHQKYFHVVDNDGQLLPSFITVSNIESDDYSAIVNGNEKVIRPRLADAAFFFATDLKQSLENRRSKLKTVVFQAKLGSIFDKSERIKALASYIADKLGTDGSASVRAAELCKSDLVSAMVYEFPEMQGIAGYHYALNDGETKEVALAIDEHYLPKFAGDKLPSSRAGAIVALADRLDTITGIFGIGQHPTGSKDPFALRRASVSVLRLIVELELELDLADLVKFAASQFNDLSKIESVVEDVLSYVLERFKAWYEEAGIDAEVFLAVNEKQLSAPLDIHRRVLAVSEFAKGSDAEALAAANKRVANILSKLDKQPQGEINEALLTEAAEKQLWENMSALQAKLQALFMAKKYSEALAQLSTLRPFVDQFFEDVMVMADNEQLRQNRLNLLRLLRTSFLEVADISLLAVKR
ncbi:glycine--tRNA ligase subunit beta [Agaribacterium haliotis]|uniref:glycine--tRNA ligase subunit beta n=1 Tax=Agaribacterium haliotis TaxID=2013869 RepID=UPI000BB5651B|nr:glycine--tRNA ligase subunit beta [Agaribacterium haliotis]